MSTLELLAVLQGTPRGRVVTRATPDGRLICISEQRPPTLAHEEDITDEQFSPAFAQVR